jgi:hypothetical protein
MHKLSVLRNAFNCVLDLAPPALEPASVRPDHEG